MLDLISILLAAVTGILLVLAIDPDRDLKPRWAAATFRAALGTGVGIGISSILFFLLDVAGAASAAVIFGLDAVMVVVFGSLWLRGRARRRQSSVTEDVSGFRWTWLLVLAFGAVLSASCVRVFQMAAALPVGGWDAWAMWNLRAKFLAGPPGAWRNAISPLVGNAHPDYPLLLPAFIARTWQAGGNMDAIAPIVTSLLFFVALVALLVSVIALLRGTASAMLAGLVILSTTSLLNWAPAQYADIPIAFYYTAAISLIFLDTLSNGEGWPLAWAGLCASFAAWTKNEGIVFLGVLVIVVFVFALLQRRSRAAVARCAPMIAGAIPGVALVLWFKFFLAPVSDPLLKQGASGFSRLLEIGRYAVVAGGFFTNLWNLGSGITHPLILVALLAVLVRCKIEDRYRLPALAAGVVVALVFLSYCGTLLITPYALSWQVQTAFDRLILQVWPGALLIFFVFLNRVADPAPVPVSAPVRKVAARSNKPERATSTASHDKVQ